MIELKEVAIKTGAFELAGVSFAVPAGAYCVLMGRTGCGKTTILEAIGGLRPVLAGRIQIGDRDVTHLRPGDRGIGYMPQDLALFPTLTVREHLEFALRLRHATAALLRERVEEMSALLGIGKLLDRRPQGLSGGEAQRVALGRALSFHPPVLLLDEPMSALDEATRGEMYDLLKRVRAKTGVTALHVTHSLSEAKALGDEIVMLEGGKLSVEWRAKD
jgi:ABC-type sugar transport system ATPase subunit